jgi:putative lipase involved disintegration of autophagic bodies
MVVRDNQRNNSNSNSNSNSNKNKSSSSTSSNHTGFTSSRVLILLGCLICFAFGLNVYLSILHDPTKTKNSNVEPIVDALLLSNNNNNITSIKKLEVDDDLIQAITTITAVKTKTKVKAKNEASSTNSTNGNANANVTASIRKR